MQERFKGWALKSPDLSSHPTHSPCSPLLYSSPLEEPCFGGIYKKIILQSTYATE